MNQISLREVLQDEPVECSAPSRIGFGGTWDLKPFVLAYPHVNPTTVNLAINLRTRVRLLPMRAGWIRVSSAGFSTEEYESRDARFDTPLGFVFATAAFFNVTGVHVVIDSDSPPKSGLGGSGVLGVALAHAFDRVLGKLRTAKPLSRRRIVEIAHLIEDGQSVSITGMQDQAAAAFGGVHRWTWRPGMTFERHALLDKNRAAQLSARILLAYCGQTHDSRNLNSIWVAGFRNAQDRAVWLELNELTKQFALAIAQCDWQAASEMIRKETAFRLKLTPDVLSPTARALYDLACEHNCSARFSGAGGGGCVWALGEAQPLASLERAWSERIKQIEGAQMLPFKIDMSGVGQTKAADARAPHWSDVEDHPDARLQHP